MGMRGYLRQITVSQLHDLQRNPETVNGLVQKKDSDNPQLMATLARLQKEAATLRTMDLSPEEQEKHRARFLKELNAVGAVLPDGTEESGLSLEKSWHVLHYLLTGKPEEAPPPLGNAILGGREIGPDLGYGPARFLNPEEVRDVSLALSRITAQDLARRFDLPAMIAAHIYPVRDENELEIAQPYFEQLARYYSEAAAAGHAMLLYVV